MKVCVVLRECPVPESRVDQECVSTDLIGVAYQEVGAEHLITTDKVELLREYNDDQLRDEEPEETWEEFNEYNQYQYSMIWREIK